MLKDKMAQIYKDNETQIKRLTAELKKCPKGSLYCDMNGNYDRWYLAEKGHGRHYLKKKDIETAMRLAHKKYLEAQLTDLQNEQDAIRAFLNIAGKGKSYTEACLSNPACKKLISHVISHMDRIDGSSRSCTSEELKAWASAEYVKNPSHPEHLKHTCLSGHVVRSKSEVLIDQALFLHQIPFRYEANLDIDDFTYYPDFTIRHPRTGKMFIWEHFGLIDQPGYARKAWDKIATLNARGYHPMENFIMTFETESSPLDATHVESIIDYYFL